MRKSTHSSHALPSGKWQTRTAPAGVEMSSTEPPRISVQFAAAASSAREASEDELT
ncbi:MAG TPA: hypothetical protein VFL98_02395 [Candidatus Paceibacterota bacterium]|nr:hypothetical protein [Candidatus Paceibacterota bacterium]